MMRYWRIALLSLLLSLGLTAGHSAARGQSEFKQLGTADKEISNSVTERTGDEINPNPYPTATSADLEKEAQAQRLAQEKAALQKELRSLTVENARISQEKSQLIESASQKILWTQWLVGLLSLVILASLFSFWRLHIQNEFRKGMQSIKNTAQRFQDSMLSFIDTSQLDTLSAVSSFGTSAAGFTNTHDELITEGNHDTQTAKTFAPDTTIKHPNAAYPSPSQEAPANAEQKQQRFYRSRDALQTNSEMLREATLPPTIKLNTKDDFSHIKGFVDAWLRVYQPTTDIDGSEFESSLDERDEKNSGTISLPIEKPTSPDAWLKICDQYRDCNDHANYEATRKKIRQLFNVRVYAWDQDFQSTERNLNDFPHIAKKILELWQGDEVSTYLERLLSNTRIGARSGFDRVLYQQLEALFLLTKEKNRPRQVKDLKQLASAQFLFAETQADTAQTLPSAEINLPKIEAAPTLPAASERAAPQALIHLPEIQHYETDLAVAQIKKIEEISQEKLAILKPAMQAHPATLTTPATPSTTTPASTKEEKSLLSPIEVRMRLALAYLDMGDTEGACLLLEDVIKDAIGDAKQQAQALLHSIEEKQTRICGNSEEIYFS